MKVKHRIKKYVKELFWNIKERQKENINLVDETMKINVNRLYYLCIILIPLVVLNIILILLNYKNMMGNTMYWKSLMALHLYIVLLIPIIIYFSKKFKDRNIVNFRSKFLVYASVTKIFILGIAFTSIDQIVTGSIVIYLLMMVLIGVVFVIRPSISIIYYISTLILYTVTIGYFQKNDNILLSIRMDGLAAAVFSYAISFITWKTNKVSILQNKLIREQQHRLERNNNELKDIAFYDYMTKLYNRRKMSDIIEEEMSYIRINEHESSIVILDIDDFKQINDKYGHPVGDKVLKELADFIDNNTRSSDSIARWGGEEFLILLPFTNIDVAYKIADKLRKKIAEYVFEVDNNKISITASFGVTSLSKEDFKFKEEAYKKADRALYKAKTGSKNKVIVFQ